MARRHASREEETEINITPMLDIVFIMLIFFIVTTSFIRETGIDPQRPEALTASRQDRGNILIAISATGQIWMDKRQVELESVRQRIEQARNESPESTVVIIADERSETGILIDLMDQIRLGGILNVSVAAQSGGQ
ncbi:biopolymer transporter ExbD [Thioalkalivibrio sp. XN279]|jgi:biopolymer transport protein ExbD|uniref:ExbD/TolR family protein n=1 Tax=Thioalkalivibrio sp. XN279 TaxID=2714953 RepID=UPI00140A2837|nr:biopolymer transporter ExbD [Thioalkalivibrio sp. XN279]NHA15655.1 biopolymer transporter ExbD [Thioalkalivibrio sp. XN279]